MSAVTTAVTELYQRMLRPQYELRLYNPSDEPVAGKFNAHDYVVPPATQTFREVKRGRVLYEHPEPGVLPLKGYSYVKAEFTKDPKTIEITPQAIAKHLVGEDGISGQLGPRGIRLLTGNPETDELIKEDARQAYLKKKYEDALYTIRAHEARVAAAVAQKQIEPPPTQKVREAYRYVSKMDSDGTSPAPAFICPRCGERAKDEKDARAHVYASHRHQAVVVLEQLGLKPLEASPAAEDVSDADLEPVTSETVKRGPGRPRKVQ